MNSKVVFISLLTVVLAVGSFFGGRMLQKALKTQSAPASIAAAPAAPPASLPTVPKPQTSFTYDHFRVGARNVKAMLNDGPYMWVGTSGGVIKYDVKNDDYVLFDNKTGLMSNGVFHLSKHGQEIWVGTYGGGLSVLDVKTSRWRNYNVPEGLGDAFIYDALRTRGGDVWVATWSGANRIRGGNLDDRRAWELFTVENTGGGLPNDWVYGLAEGKNGEIWMATEGGLARYQDGAWSKWNHADGLGAPIEIVEKDKTFNSDPAAASRHHAQQKKEQGLEGTKIAYNPNYIISLLVDDAGRVWAGTWGGGLSNFDGKTWRNYTVKDGLPANHVFMLRRGRDGNIWIGTNAGLALYDGKGFKTYSTRDGLFSDVVFSLAFADDGTTWVGSYGGVARFYKGLAGVSPKSSAKK